MEHPPLSFTHTTAHTAHVPLWICLLCCCLSPPSKDSLNKHTVHDRLPTAVILHYFNSVLDKHEAAYKQGTATITHTVPLPPPPPLTVYKIRARVRLKSGVWALRSLMALCRWGVANIMSFCHMFPFKAEQQRAWVSCCNIAIVYLCIDVTWNYILQ